jgi:hypothetical protein
VKRLSIGSDQLNCCSLLLLLLLLLHLLLHLLLLVTPSLAGSALCCCYALCTSLTPAVTLRLCKRLTLHCRQSPGSFSHTCHAASTNPGCDPAKDERPSKYVDEKH